MTEERLLELNVENIEKIIADYYKTSEENVKLEYYHTTNDYGDVDEGIICKVSEVEE